MCRPSVWQNSSDDLIGYDGMFLSDAFNGSTEFRGHYKSPIKHSPRVSNMPAVAGLVAFQHQINAVGCSFGQMQGQIGQMQGQIAQMQGTDFE